jgi:hypothetical protein
MPKKVFLLLFWLILPGSFLGAFKPTSLIDVKVNEAINFFPQGILFYLKIDSDQVIEKAALRYWTNGQSCQTSGVVHQFSFDPAKSLDLNWEWSLSMSGTIPPGTVVYYSWEITDNLGNLTEIPAQSLVFNDDRHTWKSLVQGEITLQWYQGDQSFGQSLMAIITQSLDRLANQMGAQPQGSIWITIYPTVDEVREFLLQTYEWTGGVAFPQFGGIVTSIVSGEEDWAESVLPHEIAHLVVGAATFNCYGTRLPTWLEEGLAVFSENNLTQTDRDQVYEALKNETLPPLRALTQGFSEKSNLANLEYLQGGVVVDFMLTHYDRGNMSDLFAAIKNGFLIDEALLQTYGVDTNGLESAWRESLGLPFSSVSSTDSPDSAQTSTPIPTFSLWTPISRATTEVSVTPQPTITTTPFPVTATSDLAQGLSATPVETNTALPSNHGSSFPSCGLGAAGIVSTVIWIRRRRG